MSVLLCPLTLLPPNPAQEHTQGRDPDHMPRWVRSQAGNPRHLEKGVGRQVRTQEVLSPRGRWSMAGRATGDRGGKESGKSQPILRPGQ